MPRVSEGAAVHSAPSTHRLHSASISGHSTSRVIRRTIRVPYDLSYAYSNQIIMHRRVG